jgi:hypothetical protein
VLGVEQVDGANCGVGGRSIVCSRWTVLGVEQVDGANCGVGGRTSMEPLLQLDQNQVSCFLFIHTSTNPQEDTCRKRTTSEFTLFSFFFLSKYNDLISRKHKG